jgi:sugar phosphate isomerase/epimerase
VSSPSRRAFLAGAAAGLQTAVAQPPNRNSQPFPAGVVPGGRGRPVAPQPAGNPAAITPEARLQNFWSACDECATLGIHHIEVNTTNTRVAQTYVNRLSEFKEELTKRNLKLLGLAMYAHWHQASNLSGMIEDHLQVGRFLQAVGGRYIAGLIAPAANLGNGDEESYRKVDVKAVIASCNEIGRRVREETGIEIGYHPEQGDIRAGMWDKLVDGTNPKHFGFWPDVGHLKACGVDPIAVYKKYRARMVGTHLRDYQPDAHSQRGRMVPFGQGVIDLPALVAYLRDTKFSGPVMGEGGGTEAMRDYMAGKLGLSL